jgi:hypothetical protein
MNNFTGRHVQFVSPGIYHRWACSFDLKVDQDDVLFAVENKGRTGDLPGRTKRGYQG